MQRLNEQARGLADLAAANEWPGDLSKCGSIASSVYRGLPEEYYAWVKANDFELLDLSRAKAVISIISV